MSSAKEKQFEIKPVGWVILGFLIFALGFLILNPHKKDSGISVTLVPVEQTVIEVPGFQEVTYFTVPEPEAATPATTNQKLSSSEIDIAVLSESQEGETGTSSWTQADHFRELLEKARVEILKHPYPVRCEVEVFPFFHPLDWTILAEAYWPLDSQEWCLVVVYQLLLDLPVETQLTVMAHELGHVLLGDSYPENEHDPFHSTDPDSLMYAVFDLDEEGNLAAPKTLTVRDREVYNARWGNIEVKLRMPQLSAD